MKEKKDTHMRVKKTIVAELEKIKKRTGISKTWHLNQAAEKYIEGVNNGYKKESK
jgi:hypothetical protein